MHWPPGVTANIASGNREDSQGGQTASCSFPALTLMTTRMMISVKANWSLGNWRPSGSSSGCTRFQRKQQGENPHPAVRIEPHLAVHNSCFTRHSRRITRIKSAMPWVFLPSTASCQGQNRSSPMKTRSSGLRSRLQVTGDLGQLGQPTGSEKKGPVQGLLPYHLQDRVRDSWGNLECPATRIPKVPNQRRRMAAGRWQKTGGRMKCRCCGPIFLSTVLSR